MTQLTPELTEVQAAAIAAADAKMERGLGLYEQRRLLWIKSCELPLHELRRLNDLLRNLSDDDLREVARYAEGLAEFNARL